MPVYPSINDVSSPWRRVGGPSKTTSLLNRLGSIGKKLRQVCEGRIINMELT
jgi:hypothetical protein